MKDPIVADLSGSPVPGAAAAGDPQSTVRCWWRCPRPLYALVHRIGAVRANLAAYLAPGFAVAYGAVFLGERVSLKALAGLVLILTGSYISIRH